MKIVGLLENTTLGKTLKPRHGLCVYMEAAGHKILFDLGPDDTFLHNAMKLGIDIAAVDTVVLPHGHRDHGGGLPAFLRANQRATIYAHKRAFDAHYIKIGPAKFSVGVSQPQGAGNRLVLTGETLEIGTGLLLFSDVEGQFNTSSNRVLLKRPGKAYEQDDFLHEQNLIVTEGDTSVLFCGCSHRGIANILRTAQKHCPSSTAAVGGFHLYNPATKKAEPPTFIEPLAETLVASGIRFYTCHCTGQAAFGQMATILGDAFTPSPPVACSPFRLHQL